MKPKCMESAETIGFCGSNCAVIRATKIPGAGLYKTLERGAASPAALGKRLWCRYFVGGAREEEEAAAAAERKRNRNRIATEEEKRNWEPGSQGKIRERLELDPSMDYTSSVRWLTELGLDDPDFIHHCEMSSLDQATSQHIAQALGGNKEENHHHQQTHHHHANNNNNHQHSVSAESYSNSYATPINALPPPKAVQQLEPPASRPAKVLKTSGSWKSSPAYSSCSYSPEAQVPAVVPDASSPTPRILSFGGSCNDYPAAPVVAAGGRQQQQQAAAFGPFGRALVKPKEDFRCFSISKGSTVTAGGFGADANDGNKRGASSMTNGGGGSKPPSTSQDHIIAERKRREKLSQRFIALSAIVPGLKKMDKATVLADAIKYVKQLQDRVKDLEGLTAKRTVESVVLVKKSQLVPADDDTSSSDENFDGASAANSEGGGGGAVGEPSSLPEIEAKVTDKTVLLRVHCHKRKSVLVKLLAEVERLHLSVVNTSVMPFAGSVLDITIIAQMDEEFSMSVKDLVRALYAAITTSSM